MFDAGLSLARPGPVKDSAGIQEQREIKAGLIAQSMAMAGIDAMALGAEDWSLGGPFVRGLVENHGLPVLAQNLICDGERPYPGTATFEVGGHRVGVVGVTAGTVEGCEVTDLRTGLAEGAAALADADVVIGLVPIRSDAELAVALGRGELDVDIGIDARGRLPVAGARPRSGIQFVGAGTRGKSLGLMRLQLDGGDAPFVAASMEDDLKGNLERMEVRRDEVISRKGATSDPDKIAAYDRQITAYDQQITEVNQQIEDGVAHSGNVFTLQQVQLDKVFMDHAETRTLVDAAKKAITMTGGQDPRKFIPRVVPEGPYAGGEACVSCHTEQHHQWSRTGHARAWQTLVREERALDSDCWSCHVTGANTEGGPSAPTEANGLRDVQCEACHGPGRAHAESPAEHTPVKNPSQEVCVACHDGKNDEGRFDFEAYLPKVAHPNP